MTCQKDDKLVNKIQVEVEVTKTCGPSITVIIGNSNSHFFRIITQNYALYAHYP
jgi:hypothetical protein